MKYDKKIKQEVIKRYKMGESALSIEKDDYTPSSSTIHRWINLAGIDLQIKKPIEFTNDLKEKIIHLFEKGYNTIAIGKIKLMLRFKKEKKFVDCIKKNSKPQKI